MTYLVASPGRTGSIFLTNFLQQYSAFQTGKMTYMYTVQNFFKDIEDLPVNFVIHCHLAEAILIFSKTRRLFLITRNPVEITASFLIAEQTNTFHFGNFDAMQRTRESYIQNYKDKTFKIDMQRFIWYLRFNCEWYVTAYQYQQQATIINYENVTNIDYINGLLGNDKFFVDPASLPQPQPFDKWTKIENAAQVRKTGDKIFDHYKDKYPNIFTQQHFR